jgi:HlyD family secretion protein
MLGNMDRTLTPSQRRARWWSLGRNVLLAFVALAVAGWAGARYLRPSLDRSNLRIETVERGPLEAAITASGIVVPREQQTVSSPVAAEVRAVAVSLGERVSHGQIMLQLDTTASKLELGNLEERLALNRAQVRSQELQLTDAIRQARSRRDLRAIDLESREARARRLEQLAADGIVSSAELLEARLDVKRTRVEIEQIDAEVVSLEARREAELERLELEHSILESQHADQARRVELSQVRAPLDGVVTALVQDEGAVVAAGAPLATVASQESFGIEAAVSDFYGPQLTAGQRVRVRASTNELDGRLRRILPEADGGRLRLFVDLNDPATPTLHSNLRVEVDLITAEKPDTLSVRRGPALDRGGTAHVYVVDGGLAIRKPVRLGMAGAQRVEIVDGLTAGDEIIVSDLQAYENLTEIRIR